MFAFFFQAKNMFVCLSYLLFAFLLALPQFLLCKSWFHVISCLCLHVRFARRRNFVSNPALYPRFPQGATRFSSVDFPFSKSLSARIVQSVKLKHFKSTLGLFCIDLEIQTLSKPNSIYILAPFRDQTTAFCQLSTSAAVHPHRILKSSIALARPEENESPLQAQLCAWNDVHLSHLTNSYLLFRFCSRHQNYLHSRLYFIFYISYDLTQFHISFFRTLRFNFLRQSGVDNALVLLVGPGTSMPRHRPNCNFPWFCQAAAARFWKVQQSWAKSFERKFSLLLVSAAIQFVDIVTLAFLVIAVTDLESNFKYINKRSVTKLAPLFASIKQSLQNALPGFEATALLRCLEGDSSSPKMSLKLRCLQPENPLKTCVAQTQWLQKSKRKRQQATAKKSAKQRRYEIVT